MKCDACDSINREFLDELEKITDMPGEVFCAKMICKDCGYKFKEVFDLTKFFNIETTKQSS